MKVYDNKVDREKFFKHYKDMDESFLEKLEWFIRTESGSLMNVGAEYMRGYISALRSKDCVSEQQIGYWVPLISELFDKNDLSARITVKAWMLVLKILEEENRDKVCGDGETGV